MLGVLLHILTNSSLIQIEHDFSGCLKKRGINELNMKKTYSLLVHSLSTESSGININERRFHLNNNIKITSKLKISFIITANY